MEVHAKLMNLGRPYAICCVAHLPMFTLEKGIIVAHAFTRIQTIHRMNTVTENNKMTNTGMNIK